MCHAPAGSARPLPEPLGPSRRGGAHPTGRLRGKGAHSARIGWRRRTRRNPRTRRRVSGAFAPSPADPLRAAGALRILLQHGSAFWRSGMGRGHAVQLGASWLACAWLGLAPAVEAQGAGAHAPAHTVVGKVEEHVVTGSEPIGSRRLYVLLPPDFDPKRRYPVVYAQDGQDLFDAATAAGGDEWGLDELLDARPAGIPSLIVVGIEAAPHAIRDWAPPGSTDGARADVFVEFLVEVVKPFVDRTYPTRCAAAHASSIRWLAARLRRSCSSALGCASCSTPEPVRRLRAAVRGAGFEELLQSFDVLPHVTLAARIA
jgi:hypothetical protein